MTQIEKTVSGHLYFDPYFVERRVPLCVRTNSGAYFSLGEVIQTIVGKDVKITVEDSRVIIEEES